MLARTFARTTTAVPCSARIGIDPGGWTATWLHCCRRCSVRSARTALRSVRVPFGLGRSGAPSELELDKWLCFAECGGKGKKGKEMRSGWKTSDRDGKRYAKETDERIWFNGGGEAVE